MMPLLLRRRLQCESEKILVENVGKKTFSRKKEKGRVPKMVKKLFGQFTLMQFWEV